MTTMAHCSIHRGDAGQTGVVNSADQRLVHRIRRGDPAACDELVREHGPRMRQVAMRFMRCEHDAADALQDAFLSAFQSLHTFRADAQLSTWLHRITVNACLMRLRKQRREGRLIDREWLQARSLEAAGHSGDHAADAASDQELRLHIHRSIDRLPKKYRDVVLLRDIQEKDTLATAQALGCSVANVKTRLHRAHRVLREELMASDR